VTGKIFGHNAKQARSIAKHYLVPVITAPALVNVLQNEVNSYSPISKAYFQEVSLQPSLPFLSVFLFPFLS
jgi:flagellar biosynthesis protein FlhB